MKFIISLLLPLVLFALDVYNGEVALLEIKNPQKVKSVLFENKEIPIIKQGAKSFVLVPVDYKSKKRLLSVEILYLDGKKKKIPLHVKKKRYKKETLKVSAKKVSPPKDVLDRIYKEYKEAKKIYATITSKIYWRGDFEIPLNSKITSEFGNARIFNGSLKSFHSGVDFRAKTGTPIKASNDGVVVIAKERYYAGGSVVIDHGGGLYSCYYHLSKIVKKRGDFVKKGEIVGYSGKSGRVTGPHLHFGMVLYGTIINPLQLEKVINSL